MLPNLTDALDFHAKALVLRAERQKVIASNIANADTPGYSGRDINFKEAMTAAVGGTSLSLHPQPPSSGAPSGMTNSRHIPLPPSTASMGSGQSRGLLVGGLGLLRSSGCSTRRRRSA